MWEAASRCLIFRSSLDRSKPGGKCDPATSRRFFVASMIFQCMWLGTVSLHAQLPLWRERNSLSVTDSYRGRSGDEGRVNVLSANVSALVYTTRNSGALGPEVSSIQFRNVMRLAQAESAKGPAAEATRRENPQTLI